MGGYINFIEQPAKKFRVEIIDLMKMQLKTHKERNEGKKCKECNDTGWRYRRDKNGDYEAAVYGLIEEPCSCQGERRLKKQLKKRGLLERLEVNSLGNYKATTEEQKKAKMKVGNYITNFHSSFLVITGQSGTGKTHLGLAAWHEIVKKNNKDKMLKGTIGEVIPFTDLINELEGSVRFDSLSTVEQVLDKYKNASILLIDDLFKNNETETAKRWIFSIIDYRANKSMPTIITTEKTIDGLLSIDQAIGGRIKYQTRNEEFLINFEKNAKNNYRLKGE